MRAFLLIPIALAAVVSATQLEQRSPFHAIRSSLVARTDVVDPAVIPSQCQKACANVVNDLNSCSSIDCLCTNSNGKQLEQCVDCLVKVGNSASATSNGQETLDAFASGCNAAGMPIDNLTVSSNSAPHLVANGGVLAAVLAGAVAYLF